MWCFPLFLLGWAVGAEPDQKTQGYLASPGGLSYSIVPGPSAHFSLEQPLFLGLEWPSYYSREEQGFCYL